MRATAVTPHEARRAALGMGTAPGQDGKPAITAQIAHLALTLGATMRHTAPATTSSRGDEGDEGSSEALLLAQGVFSEAPFSMRGPWRRPPRSCSCSASSVPSNALVSEFW